MKKTNYFELENFLKENNLPGIFQKHYNQYSAKPLILPLTENSAEYFNKIYLTVKNKTDLGPLIRTRSGGIAQNNNYCFDIKTSAYSVRLTIILGGKVYVLNIGANQVAEKEIYPDQAFYIFEDLCKKYKIDLNKYKVSDGLEIKKIIEKPLIRMKYSMAETDPGLDQVNHIDFNSSYPAGLVNSYPEFAPVINELYSLKEIDPKYKAVLNYSIGYMQSYKPEKRRFAELAKLSKAAIADNNKRIKQLACMLEITGREILGFNTDGIWYRGKLYSDENCGTKLGQYKNDHVNCLFRSKSAGAYEFIENNIYHAVVRGSTSLDTLAPDRSKWSWGDIYRGCNIIFTFDKDLGLVKKIIEE